MPVNFEILKNYIPKKSLPIVTKWFNQRAFDLKITKKRITKFGDFRASDKGKSPQISINSNLNEYAFLITLTHEFAHLLVWDEHKHKAKAHGLEWKTEFSTLTNVLLVKNIFPDHVATVLEKHIKNPAASSARDVQLVNELRKYDSKTTTLYLADLPEGATFTLNNKRIFKKGKKRRTRYLCEEISSKKGYLIHGIAEVLVIEK